eukprot:TRINITY_DN66734_c8_g19_i1.p1 TRINITY_DN66734_c8_g19~~TRINITY_DN66734_c8_g19_i1.p1  ORF type:complete len:1080 (-),score=177.25 TRINITY_DN66734_c8_g19_i1:752-3991(-)
MVLWLFLVTLGCVNACSPLPAALCEKYDQCATLFDDGGFSVNMALDCLLCTNNHQPCSPDFEQIAPHALAQMGWVLSDFTSKFSGEPQHLSTTAATSAYHGYYSKLESRLADWYDDETGATTATDWSSLATGQRVALLSAKLQQTLNPALFTEKQEELLWDAVIAHNWGTVVQQMLAVGLSSEADILLAATKNLVQRQEFSGHLSSEVPQGYTAIQVKPNQGFQIIVEGDIDVHVSTETEFPDSSDPTATVFHGKSISVSPSELLLMAKRGAKSVREATIEWASPQVWWNDASGSVLDLQQWVDHTEPEDEDKMRTMTTQSQETKTVYIGMHLKPHSRDTPYRVKFQPQATYDAGTGADRGWPDSPVWDIGRGGPVSHDGEDPTQNNVVTGDIRIEFVITMIVLGTFWTLTEYSSRTVVTRTVVTTTTTTTTTKEEKKEKTSFFKKKKKEDSHTTKVAPAVIETEEKTEVTHIKRKNSTDSKSSKSSKDSKKSDKSNPLARPSSAGKTTTTVVATAVVQEKDEYVASAPPPVTSTTTYTTQTVVTTTETSRTLVRRGSPLYVYEIRGRIAYDYYQGDWKAVPDHTNLTVVDRGFVRDFTHIPPSGYTADNQFFYRYRAKMFITEHGQYVFWTRSGDASIVCVDGIKLVNNDGLHESKEQTSQLIELAGGWHDLEVKYMHNHPAEQHTPALEVWYKGPDAPEGLRIPEHILSPGKGRIDYNYYHGDFSSLPTFPNEEVIRSGNTMDFTAKQASVFTAENPNFAYKFNCKMQLQTPGQYTFATKSACGSRLSIDNETIVNNDGVHAIVEQSNTTTCTRGWHDLEVGYFYNNQNKPSADAVTPTLEVQYKLPEKQATQEHPNPTPRIMEPIPERILAPGKGKIQYEYFQGDFTRNLPDFKTAELFELGFCEQFTAHQPSMFASLMYAYRFRTRFHVDNAGGFTFWLNSCCGSALMIDGEMVILHDGMHGRDEKTSVHVLTSGYHDIEVRYFYNGVGQADGTASTPNLAPFLELWYKAPDNPERSLLPDSVLSVVLLPEPEQGYVSEPTPMAATTEAAPPVQELEEEQPTTGNDESVPPPVTP